MIHNDEIVIDAFAENVQNKGAIFMFDSFCVFVKIDDNQSIEECFDWTHDKVNVWRCEKRKNFSSNLYQLQSS